MADYFKTRTNQPRGGGFINFGDLYSANQGSAQNYAKSLANQTSYKATQASSSINDLSNQFNQQVSAGTGGSPTNVGSMTLGSFGAAPYVPGQGAQGQGYGVTPEQMTSGSNQQYTGPGGLGDVSGSQNVYNQTAAAQQQLNALGNQGGLQALVQQGSPALGAGAAGWSAGLVGAGGAGRFSALQRQFNPAGQLGAAGMAAQQAAQAARDTTEKNAQAWKDLQKKNPNGIKVDVFEPNFSFGGQNYSAPASEYLNLNSGQAKEIYGVGNMNDMVSMPDGSKLPAWQAAWVDYNQNKAPGESLKAYLARASGITPTKPEAKPNGTGPGRGGKGGTGKTGPQQY